MHELEERIRRLEGGRARFRLAAVALVPALIALGVLAGAALDQPHQSPIKDQVMARSVVIVDDENRPRIDLGVDASLGSRIFIRDEQGIPVLTFTTMGGGGSITVLDRAGLPVARLSASTTGDGLLRLSDKSGHTITRLGRWGDRKAPGLEFYPQVDQPGE
ncbi:MAG: hypothetical protein MK116_10340 [Phycisphaerales bacterium]|nr:hypothetical protein [Phycisphaerales bacterium]